MMENMAHQYCPGFQMNIQLGINSHQAKKGPSTHPSPSPRRDVGKQSRSNGFGPFPSLAILLKLHPLHHPDLGTINQTSTGRSLIDEAKLISQTATLPKCPNGMRLTPVVTGLAAFGILFGLTSPLAAVINVQSG
jgi:hypothetical protein